MTLDPSRFRPATNLVHGGVQRTHHGETAEALFLTSGYVYDDAEQAEATFAGTVEHYQYSRFANPTLSMLEQRLCLLEGAEDCRTTATRMAAVNAAMLSHLKAGDRVVAARALFGSCHWIVSTLLPKFGIEAEFVDGADRTQWRAALSRSGQSRTAGNTLEPDAGTCRSAIRGGTCPCSWCDRRGRQRLRHTAAPAAAETRRRCGRLFLHQTHGTDREGSLGGAVLGTKKWINDTLQPFIRNTGPALSPFNAWILLKGLETLALRVDAATRAASAIADFLAEQPGVTRIWYPMREDHPQQALARQQMTGGGTVVTFEVAGGKPGAFRVMNGFRLIAVSNNLGDSKSLATHPANHHSYAHRRGGACTPWHNRRRHSRLGGAGGRPGHPGRSAPGTQRRAAVKSNPIRASPFQNGPFTDWPPARQRAAMRTTVYSRRNESYIVAAKVRSLGRRNPVVRSVNGFERYSAN